MAATTRFPPSRSRQLAALLLLGAAACAVQGLSPGRDPLRLAAWLSNDPIPSDVLRRIRAGARSTVHAVTLPPPAAAGAAADAAAEPAAPGARARGRALLQPISANALNVRPGMRAGSDVRAWVTGTINPVAVGAPIPSTFLGISHEWTNVEELNHGGRHQQLIQDLRAYGGGPLVLRVGGGSTDMQTALPPRSTWDALLKLQHATGMMFIFGLNFLKGDSALAMAQMDAARGALPAYSIMGFELGNEPNFYPAMGGKPTREWLNCCFVNEWALFARNLSCRGPLFSGCQDGQFAGPVWGHVKMWPRTLDWFMRLNNRWLNLVTVHWYHSRRETISSTSALLDEASLRADMASLRELVKVANQYGKPLRVAEMNTVSNSGRQGISDSLAAALWTLDGALEVAAAGAVGINLHWGDGLSLYAALLRQGSGSSIVKPPYYAYLLFQMALGGGASFVEVGVAASGGAQVKVWGLLDVASGALRVVLINKAASGSSGLVLRLPSGGSSGQYGDGKLVRLMGRDGLGDEWNVRLGNMTYNLGGDAFGIPAGEVISREPVPPGTAQEKAGSTSGSSPGGWQYNLYMPAGSAALLVIPRSGR